MGLVGGWVGIEDRRSGQAVGSTNHSDDLLPTALAACGSLDNSRQVEQLNLGVAVFYVARNASECSEFVSSLLALRRSQLRQQR